MNVSFAEDRLDDVGIFFRVFLYDFRSCVWGRIIVDQYFEGKCRLLGQESFQAVPNILFMFVGRAMNADKWRWHKIFEDKPQLDVGFCFEYGAPLENIHRGNGG